MDPVLVSVARRLRAGGIRFVGLLAAGPVRVGPVAEELCRALTVLAGGKVACVTRYGQAETADDSGSASFATTWVNERIARLVPLGAPGPWLAAELKARTEPFEHVAVDLSDTARSGDLESVVLTLDRVILLARAAKTREQELVKAAHTVPPALILGVLLIH